MEEILGFPKFSKLCVWNEFSSSIFDKKFSIYNCYYLKSINNIPLNSSLC